MGVIIYLIAGAVVGYLAGQIMNSNTHSILNILAGVVGAFVAGWFISPLLGIGTINEGITFSTMLVSLGGAILLLFVVKLFRGGGLRKAFR